MIHVNFTTFTYAVNFVFNICETANINSIEERNNLYF